MIIVEGPDLAGKSTFCDRLVKSMTSWPYMVRHLTRLHEGHDRYWDYVQQMHPNIIWDRFFHSENVYCKARGDTPAISRFNLRLLHAHTSLNAGYTVLLLPTEDVIRQRWRDGEMYDLDTVLRANYFYWEFASENDYLLDKVIHITSPEYDSREDIDEIVKAVTVRRVCCSNILRSKSPFSRQ